MPEPAGRARAADSAASSTPDHSSHPLALVTGASSGIGYHLARLLGERGFDLMVVAEDDGIHPAARSLGSTGAHVIAAQCDLGDPDDVEELAQRVLANDRLPQVIAFNAGVGLGGRFLDTPLERELEVIRVNAVSVVHLSKRLLPAMVAAGHGRVLYTASMLSEIPATYMAVYGASKAFVLSFAQALRAELADTGVSVTAVLPGATDTHFFRRADAYDTPIAHGPLDDPADVAADALDALFAGDDKRVAGSARNAAMATLGRVTPDRVNATLHGKVAEPGAAEEKR